LLHLIEATGRVCRAFETHHGRAGASGDAPYVPIPPDYQPFPTESLPQPLRTFIATSAAALGCDASFIAVPLLSMLAGCTRNRRAIALKQSWHEPCIIWTAIVGESGTLKSPAFRRVIQPLRDWQNKAILRQEEAEQLHEREL